MIRMLERAASSGQDRRRLIRRTRRIASATACLVAVACGGGEPVRPVDNRPPVATGTISTLVAVVGAPINFDATRAGSAFSDPKGSGLTYSITLSPSANGLTIQAGAISGS